ncbi:MAG: (2Fe-2S)-binding protein [Gemmatimonadales bacterium]|nr:(2Fe-2S)-binding protein [Gemmatimonadota bacterium]MCL4214595.1 (2Fe-2S)-binding protein [Gemmatimonadales bacterium]
MTEPIRVFVNGAGVSVAPGSTVIDALEAADAAAAAAVRDGTRGVVDSRGLPVAPNSPVSGGFVMRLVSARAAAGDA